MTVTNGGPPLRVSNREEDSMNLEPSLSGKDIVGIIFPPPDIRSIVDKTANFVAKNGVEFENKIKEREATNSKFAFLNPADPYHAYYKHKVKEIETNEICGIKAPPAPPGQLPPQAPDAVRAHIREKEVIPEQPKGFEYMVDPSTINGYDLDVLRLTALFVARNGRQFLTQLMNREIRNFQFDFLKPQHSNFPYFTKLVEQYSMVILPAQNIDTELGKTASYEQVSADVKNRVAWEKYQKAAKDRANEESERERLAYAQIEWHDFVVVQTVDFQPSETSNLPPLCTPRDVGTRILMQQREEQRAASEAVEMEVESESDEGESSDNEEVQRDRDGFVMPTSVSLRAQPRQPPPTADIPDDVIVRDYDPKKRPAPKAKIADQYIISPLTNERIPANKLEEHVRYNTVDPQYKVQRDREMLDRIDEDPTNASGTEISRNISKLAERRTDIFGVGEKSIEQTAIGRKLGEEERNPNQIEKPTWDGPQASNPQQEANIQALLNKHEQERAAAAAAAASASAPPVNRLLNVPQPPGVPPLMGLPPGFMPPPPPGFPLMPGAPRLLAPPPHIQDALNLPPPPKKPRPDDGLVPEDMWLQRVNGPINLVLILPHATEWNVTGGQEHVSLDVTSQVGQIKSIVQDKCGIPASKQKLQFDNIFIKDNNSLAYYNMDNNSQIMVQLKERGGRKK